MQCKRPSPNKRKQDATALRASAGRPTLCTFCAGRCAPSFAQNVHSIGRPCCGRYASFREHNMKRIISIIFTFLAVSGCKTTSVKNDVDTAFQIAHSEYLGKKLYDAVLSEDGSSPYTSREQDLLEMSKDLVCEGKYKAVSVVDEKFETENIYLVLSPEKDSGVQFGRHLKFRFRLGTNDIVDVSPSTKTCLLVPAEGDSIPFSTHLVSNVPTEFHVFLSLYHEKPIYVSTSTGLWSIEAGKAALVK